MVRTGTMIAAAVMLALATCLLRADSPSAPVKDPLTANGVEELFRARQYRSEYLKVLSSGAKRAEPYLEAAD
jgi:hypothetical protein